MSSAGQLRLLRKAEKMGGGLGVDALTMKGRLKSFVMRHKAHMGKEEQRNLKFAHETLHDDDGGEDNEQADTRPRFDEQDAGSDAGAAARRAAAEARREREEAERLVRQEEEERLRQKKAAARRKKVHIEDLPLPEPKAPKKKHAPGSALQDSHSVGSGQEAASVDSGGQHDSDEAARSRADSLASTLSSDTDVLEGSGDWGEVDEEHEFTNNGDEGEWLEPADSDDDDYPHHRHPRHRSSPGQADEDEPEANDTESGEEAAGVSAAPTAPGVIAVPILAVAASTMAPLLPPSDIPPEATSRLYIICSRTVTPGQLKYLFGKYPGLTYIDLKQDKKAGKSKGFAFVGYKTVAAAASARKAINGEVLGGQKVKVMFAAPPAAPGKGPKAAAGSKKKQQQQQPHQPQQQHAAGAAPAKASPSTATDAPNAAAVPKPALVSPAVPWAAVAKGKPAAAGPAPAVSSSPPKPVEPARFAAASTAPATVGKAPNGKPGPGRRAGRAAMPPTGAAAAAYAESAVPPAGVTPAGQAAGGSPLSGSDSPPDGVSPSSSVGSLGGTPVLRPLAVSPVVSKPSTPLPGFQRAISPPPGAHHHQPLQHRQAGQPVFRLGANFFSDQLDLNFFHTTANADPLLAAQMSVLDIQGARELERVALVEVDQADADVRAATAAAREAEVAAAAAAAEARRAAEAARLAELAAHQAAVELQSAVARAKQARENVARRTAETLAAAERVQAAQLAVELQAMPKLPPAPVTRPAFRFPALETEALEDDGPADETFAEALLMNLLA